MHSRTKEQWVIIGSLVISRRISVQDCASHVYRAVDSYEEKTRIHLLFHSQSGSSVSSVTFAIWTPDCKVTRNLEFPVKPNCGVRIHPQNHNHPL